MNFIAINKRNSSIAICTVSIVLLFISFVIINVLTRRADEVIHFQEVRRILNGDPHQDIGLTMFPTYHYIVAGIAHVLHISYFRYIRRINFALNLLAPLFFYLSSRSIHRDDNQNALRLLLFISMPIMLPFYTMLYTDVLALAFVLLGIYGWKTDRVWLSGIGFFIATLIRQNYILWLLLPLIDIVKQSDRKLLFRYILSYGIPILLTGIFLLIVGYLHGGLIYDLSQSDSHPLIIHCGNILFCIGLVAILFLPQSVQLALQDVRSFFHAQYKNIVFIFIAGVIAYCFAYHVFANSNHFNLADERSPHLRNITLSYIDTHRWILFVCLFYGIRILKSWACCGREIVGILLISFTMLSMSWLIEQRYYFSFLTSTLLFLPYEKLIMRFLIPWWLVLSTTLLIAYAHNLLF